MMGAKGSGRKGADRDREEGGQFGSMELDEAARAALIRALKRLDLADSLDRAKAAQFLLLAVFERAITTNDGKFAKEVLTELRQEASVSKIAAEIEELKASDAALRAELAEVRRASGVVTLPVDFARDGTTSSSS
jgi:hypothetical protein